MQVEVREPISARKPISCRPHSARHTDNNTHEAMCSSYLGYRMECVSLTWVLGYRMECVSLTWGIDWNVLVLPGV